MQFVPTIGVLPLDINQHGVAHKKHPSLICSWTSHFLDPDDMWVCVKRREPRGWLLSFACKTQKTAARHQSRRASFLSVILRRHIRALEVTPWQRRVSVSLISRQLCQTLIYSSCALKLLPRPKNTKPLKNLNPTFLPNCWYPQSKKHSCCRQDVCRGVARAHPPHQRPRGAAGRRSDFGGTGVGPTIEFPVCNH